MIGISLQDVSNIVIAIVGMLSVIVLILQTTILRKQSKIMEKQTQITESQTKIMNAQTEISESVAFSVEPIWAATTLIVVIVKNEGTGLAREASITWSIVRGEMTH